ncbi:hypothetical protein Pmar_PMAR026602 [Perkinsus marinus ATCC 50983]|uniref:Uncharacterized protein n=1 Tax=Perkinsus marinus (strain ATCC 50983 / TXsc) TaxID=423536 RepID=C5KEN0_PERM5|nr:hypothetical protein Pmar_PMAR026602 [Perkinsus marinus ATCC 50983]EER17063.1 hypothetical protein Pmar_PMAR026602 [Perkinsus marinus ATCC 50983]|eukprot:XP_002785267.1 hypothetical protein Pmar_PMAR026602 [Perkinsus marinus ATCC 50983]
MSQTSELSSNAADGVLAEDLEDRPVLIKSTSTPQNGAKQQRERNLTAKWSRAFWWFAIALLSVQEALHLKDGSLGNSVDIPNACLANVELEGQPIDNVMILDLLQYFHKILWYATEYNWSVAIAVDRAIRMAIEDACRGGSRTLADCYRNLDLWSAKASEAANLSMGTPRSARSSYLGGDSPSDKPWASSSSSRRLSPSTPSRQGFKRPRDNRFPARLPPPKQQYPNSNNNDNKSSNYNKHDITPKM